MFDVGAGILIGLSYAWLGALFPVVAYIPVLSRGWDVVLGDSDAALVAAVVLWPVWVLMLAVVGWVVAERAPRDVTHG